MTGFQFNLLTFVLFLLVDFTFMRCFRKAARYQPLALLLIWVNIGFMWWLPTYIGNTAFLLAVLGIETKEIFEDQKP